MSFQAPIGSVEERATGTIWPGGWTDATPFLTRYSHGIHTGADLNLNLPGAWDSDKLAPVYAMGDGTVIYAQKWPNPKYWGKIVVIDHGIVDNRPLFSRYAHVADINVAVGQPVHIGDQIAKVGDGDGLFFYHLHFDISISDILRGQPNNWPAPKAIPDPKLVKQHYVDPKKWLQEHFVSGIHRTTNNPLITPPVVPPDLPVSRVLFVIARDGLFVRDQPSTSSSKRASLLQGARVSVEAKTVNQDSYTWAQISEGKQKGRWFAIGKSDQSDIFVSSDPPEN